MIRNAMSVLWLSATLGFLAWIFFIGSPEFEAFARDQLALGALFGFLLLTTSQIAAPLSGFPVFIVICRIYGIEFGFMILFAAYSISSVVNFVLASRFGRPAVAAIIGKSNLARVESWVSGKSVLLIVTSRVLGYYYHDIISYAWGLTPVKFWKYYATTMLATAAPLAVEYWILRQIKLDDSRGLLMFYGAMMGMAVVFVAAWAVFRGLERKSATDKTSLG